MDVVVECRRSGHIPPFGNWDYANDLPITQYFESARQAGLIRFCDQPTHTVVVSSRKKRASQVAGTRHTASHNLTPQVKDDESGYKVVKSHIQHQQQQQKKHKFNGNEKNKKKIINTSNQNKSNSFKPVPVVVVDEDLYKIPPHLLHTSKRKKMLGFLSRCLGPGCTV